MIYDNGLSENWMAPSLSTPVNISDSANARTGSKTCISALVEPFANVVLSSMPPFSSADTILDTWLHGSALSRATLRLQDFNAGRMSSEIILANTIGQPTTTTYRLLGPTEDNWFRLQVNLVELTSKAPGPPNPDSANLWDAIIFEDASGQGFDIYIDKMHLIPSVKNTSNSGGGASGDSCVGTVCNPYLTASDITTALVPLYGGDVVAQSDGSSPVIARLLPGVTAAQVVALCAELTGPEGRFNGNCTLQSTTDVTTASTEPVTWPFLAITAGSESDLKAMRSALADQVEYFDRDKTASISRRALKESDSWIFEAKDEMDLARGVLARAKKAPQTPPPSPPSTLSSPSESILTTTPATEEIATSATIVPSAEESSKTPSNETIAAVTDVISKVVSPLINRNNSTNETTTAAAAASPAAETSSNEDSIADVPQSEVIAAVVDISSMVLHPMTETAGAAATPARELTAKDVADIVSYVALPLLNNTNATDNTTTATAAPSVEVSTASVDDVIGVVNYLALPLMDENATKNESDATTVAASPLAETTLTPDDVIGVVNYLSLPLLDTTATATPSSSESSGDVVAASPVAEITADDVIDVVTYLAQPFISSATNSTTSPAPEATTASVDDIVGIVNYLALPLLGNSNSAPSVETATEEVVAPSPSVEASIQDVVDIVSYLALPLMKEDNSTDNNSTVTTASVDDVIDVVNYLALPLVNGTKGAQAAGSECTYPWK